MSRRQDADRAAASIARIGRLEEALRKAAEQFRFYETQHMAKTPPDIGKAATNRAMAELCEQALARPDPVKAATSDPMQCQACGELYRGDRAGCYHRDPKCPMRGKAP